MRKHRYVIANKNRFIVFCASLLLTCMVGGYMMGAAITAKAVEPNTSVVYYAPKHFASQRAK